MSNKPTDFVYTQPEKPGGLGGGSGLRETRISVELNARTGEILVDFDYGQEDEVGSYLTAATAKWLALRLFALAHTLEELDQGVDNA